MAQLGTLSIDFLVNLQNSLNQVGQLENRIAELERTARDSRRAVDDIGNSRIGNITGAFDNASGAINRFRGGLQGALSGGGGIGDLVGAFRGIPPQALLAAGSVIAITAAVTGLGIAVYSSLNSIRQQGDELDKTSQKLGVNVEALQGLRYAAQLSGMEADKLNDAFKEINMTLGDDAESEKAKLFNELGVSLKTAAGQAKTADEILIDSADAFAKLGSDTERSILAMKLFGEEGKEMVPLLKQGSEAVREQINEHKELGGVISKETTKQAAAFNDSLTKLNVVLESGKKALAEAFLPSAMLVVDVILELAKSIKSMLPEGKSFQQIILDVTKGGLRLLLQAVDATIKQINNFGRILVVAAPLIAQVGLNLTLTANAASILVNALDILQGFIRVGVLTVLDAMVQGLENVVGGMASVARAAGLDDLASKLSTAESSLRGMSSALAGLSADAMAGIRTDTQDIAVDIQDATNALMNFGKTVDGIQSFGADLTGIQSPTAGAYKALEDKIDNLTDAVDENTNATNEGTKTNKEGNKGAKGAGGAVAAAKRIETAVDTFEKLSGSKLKLEPGFRASDVAQTTATPYNKQIEAIDKKILEEKRKQRNLEKNINKTQGERQQKLLQKAEAEKEIAFLSDKNILLDSELVFLGEDAVNNEAKINENSEKRDSLEKRANELQVTLNRIKAVEIGGLLVSAAVAGVAGGAQGAAAGAAVGGPAGALVGGIGGAAAAGAATAIFQAEVTVPAGDKIFTEATDLLTVQQELANILAIQGEYEQANVKLSGDLLKNGERRAEVQNQMLQNEGKAVELANEATGLSQLEGKLNKDIAASKRTVLTLEEQRLERQRQIESGNQNIQLAQLRYLESLGLIIQHLDNEKSLLTEQDAIKRQTLELDNARIRHEQTMIELLAKNLEGLEFEAEFKRILLEYNKEEQEIRERTKSLQDAAVQKSKEDLETIRQKAETLSNLNTTAAKEIEILNTKNAFQRIELEFALERLKLSIETLTPLQMELELLKLKLEQEEAITAEKVKQVEMTGQAIGGLGSVGGQFAGMMEKLGFSEETSRVVGEISTGLGGVATGVSGVARLMTGDIVGGITGIVSGALTTFESIFDIFNPEEDETEKLDLTPLQPDADTLRQQAEEFAKAFVDEQERRLQRPIQITVDARGALVGDDAEVARALGNLLEGEMGRRIGNINVPRGF